MDLRKYSVSEFSEMLENEMKLNKEKCEKIAKYYEMKRDIKNDLEITYKIVAPVEKNVYYRRPLEMTYNYESTLWGMKEAQISSFTGVKNKEYFVNTINYCRAKYIKEAIEEIIKIKSIPEENEFSIYSEQEFVLDSWMDYPKVYLLEEWPEEDCHYFHKIIPSAAGFMHFVMDGNTIMAGEEYIKSNIRKIRQRSW